MRLRSSSEIARSSTRKSSTKHVHVRMKVHQVGVADVWAIAAETDGIDGSEDNAGAVPTDTASSTSAARTALTCPT